MNIYPRSRLALLFFLLAGLGVTVFMIDEQTILSSRAYTNIPTDSQSIGTEKLRTITQSIEKEAQKNRLITKTFPEAEYQMSFDSTLWEKESETFSQQNQSHVFTLVLKKDVGSALIKITANPLTALLEKKQENQGTASLDTLEYIALLEEENTQKGNIVQKEKILLANLPAYRFIKQEEYFGTTTQYDEYVLATNNKYYKIVARHDSFTSAPELIQPVLNSLVFSPLDTNAVRGASSNRIEQDTYQTAQLAELVRPSVVNILHITCIRVLAASSPAPLFLKAAYKYCSSAKGTGMIINDEGYIATNGHVVKPYAEQVLVEELLRSPSQPFMQDLIQEVSAQKTGKLLAPAEVPSMIQTVQGNPNAFGSLLYATFQLIDKQTISVANDESKTYIQTGIEPFIWNEEQFQRGNLAGSVDQKPSILEAVIVDFNYPNTYSTEAILRNKKQTGTDVAILKIKNGERILFPSLLLGNTHILTEGEPIMTMGYPSLVEGGNSSGSFLDYSLSSITPTVTRGIVSAIKKDKNGYRVIQTDASIERGNSGGPALNEQGEAIGMVTFGFSGSLGNYNFLRDIEDVRTLANKNRIDLTKNSLFSIWRIGLINFWGDYYTQSIRSFQKVKQSYPYHPLADEYIKRAEQGVLEGRDKGLFFGIEKSLIYKTLLILPMIAVGFFIIYSFVVKRTEEKARYPR